MTKTITLIQGHPDSGHPHLCHLLADAYADGARATGHTVQSIDVASLSFPLLRSKNDWEHGPTPESLLKAQKAIMDSDHLVVLYPLWLGTLPALLKGFLEQVLRPSLLPQGAGIMDWRKLKKGCSVRIIVTMGMPALAYRLFYRAHSLKSLERNIFAFAGFGPMRSSLIGMVDGLSTQQISKLCHSMAKLGRKAM